MILPSIGIVRVLLRCMGFHSAKDRRMPVHFVCFDCRVRADQNWELIVLHDLYPRMVERFKDLAIFRYVGTGNVDRSADGGAPQTGYQGF